MGSRGAVARQAFGHRGEAEGMTVVLTPKHLAGDAALAAHSPAAAAAAPAWHLLPAFDEHLLGYTDRGAQLDAEDAARIVPGKNGMFLATVTRSGKVVGTWKREAAAGRGAGRDAVGKACRIAALAFPGEHIDTEALAPRLAEWARFHGYSV